MAEITHVDEQHRVARQESVRVLLQQPFLTDAGRHRDALAKVRRHADWLRAWFSEQLGYRLVVETGFARLHKRALPGGAIRPLQTRSGTAYDRRRYALLCLVLAALEKSGVQTTLSQLAEQVKVFATQAQSIATVDFDRPAERQAFVDSIRHLCGIGLLRLADGDDKSFVEGKGDALYDIDTRLLPHMLACPIPPSVAKSPDRLDPELHESGRQSGGDAARTRQARHRLMRRLVEEPVVYTGDLDDDETAYLATQRHYLLKQVRIGLGLDAEVRREGLAVLDPDGRCTDLRFPGTGTVSHAALLLIARIVKRSRDGDEITAVPRQRLRQDLDRLADQFGRHWAKSRIEDNRGRDQLLADALDLLVGMNLVATTPEGVIPRPAIARYAAPSIRTVDARARQTGNLFAAVATDW